MSPALAILNCANHEHLFHTSSWSPTTGLSLLISSLSDTWMISCRLPWILTVILNMLIATSTLTDPALRFIQFSRIFSISIRGSPLFLLSYFAATFPSAPQPVPLPSIARGATQQARCLCADRPPSHGLQRTSASLWPGGAGLVLPAAGRRRPPISGELARRRHITYECHRNRPTVPSSLLPPCLQQRIATSQEARANIPAQCAAYTRAARVYAVARLPSFPRIYDYCEG
jgi:hypothetical protein